MRNQALGAGSSTLSMESSVRIALNCRICSWCPPRTGELLGVGKKTTHLMSEVLVISREGNKFFLQGP